MENILQDGLADAQIEHFQTAVARYEQITAVFQKLISADMQEEKARTLLDMLLDTHTQDELDQFLKEDITLVRLMELEVECDKRSK